MYDFSNQVFIVTGAAGNLGKAVVKVFLDAGGTVFGLDHKKGRLEDLKTHAVNNGKLFVVENVDVTDRESMLLIAEKIQKQTGIIDVAINTVGGFTSGQRVDELTPGTWQKMMDINVHSLLNAAAAFVPFMIEQGHGKFIGVGSRSALNGGARTGAYAAAKASVVRLIESMAAELKNSNIQANCVLPGTIDTPENRKEMPNADTSKWVTPEQVADVIKFLASPAADAITGAAIPVFG